MIEIEITDKMKRRAWDRSKRMGKLKKSITDGKGNIAGFLGEEVANTIIKGKIEHTKDYDIIKDGTKIDIKTKKCTSKPKPDYECSIASYNTVQKCDYYGFVRIENIKGKWGRAWFLGVYPKNEYFKDAVYLKKGQKNGSNWFTVKANCYNLPIYKLQDWDNMKTTETNMVKKLIEIDKKITDNFDENYQLIQEYNDIYHKIKTSCGQIFIYNDKLASFNYQAIGRGICGNYNKLELREVKAIKDADI